ncbi:MAG TPA: signal recognition particle receptor subunit alpha, partial [Armatimonadota bacterium]|nr:signal recognition particle receptor subunit alpha [Armatimonadota bacterium]
MPLRQRHQRLPFQNNPAVQAAHGDRQRLRGADHHPLKHRLTAIACLRARLARSNSALGKGLLALLSGGKLDEAAWEEVEDTLLAADLGVAATTELVDSLRTKVAVEGT